MLEPWTHLESQDVFRNRWLHVTVDRFRLPNDQEYEYTTIRRDAAGVGVAVLDERNRMLLEREFRPPVGEVLYQIPGGLTNGDEDPADCIRRELEEETGYVAGQLHFLGEFYNNPASSNSRCLIYLCRDARPGGNVRRDAAEFMTFDWYDLDWVKARAGRHDPRDRVVVCALAYLWLAGEIEVRRTA
ncbi:MAG: NUDIX hydrolase [Caldilineales bacterium]